MRRLSAIAGVLLFLTFDAAHAGAQTVLTGEAGHAFYHIVVRQLERPARDLTERLRVRNDSPGAAQDNYGLHEHDFLD